MPQIPKKTHRVALLVVGILLGIPTLLVLFSQDLFQTFYNMTDHQGPRPHATKAVPGEAGAPLTIYFDANVAPGLSLDFRPEKRMLETHVGEATRIDFLVRNTSAEPLTMRAVYNVTPAKAAPYFFKMQCFCFANQKLAPGESARLPVVFYLDPAMMGDAADANVITLSYTFFPMDGLTPQQVADMADLKATGETAAQTIASGEEADFDNDAPRN
jgi:cytochrome c oxidase assembly protein subunit 11